MKLQGSPLIRIFFFLEDSNRRRYYYPFWDNSEIDVTGVFQAFPPLDYKGVLYGDGGILGGAIEISDKVPKGIYRWHIQIKDIKGKLLNEDVKVFSIH